jgi:hypothetical protein
MGDIAVTTLRLPAGLMEQVREAARQDRRSLSGEIAVLIEEALAARSSKMANLPKRKRGLGQYLRGAGETGD